MKTCSRQGLRQRGFCPHGVQGLPWWPMEAFWFINLEALQTLSFGGFMEGSLHSHNWWTDSSSSPSPLPGSQAMRLKVLTCNHVVGSLSNQPSRHPEITFGTRQKNESWFWPYYRLWFLVKFPNFSQPQVFSWTKNILYFADEIKWYNACQVA